MLPYALTIFTGAFLLFQVQPLIGKYILPWFGGSPGVWTTCMLFFQVLLLGGYAYAHISSTRLRPRQQALLHLVLLMLSLAFLPIIPSETWKPVAAGDPTGRILLLLLASLGLPYFVLSSTGPLMQQWFAQTHPGASPYRLYALSNIGSLLALLSYPFYFEWALSRHAQAALWSVGLCVFVVLCGFCALRLRKHPRVLAENAAPRRRGEETAGAAEPRPSVSDQALWIGLPAIASVLLLATTNKLCQDVAVIPFLWVLPLSLYLLSFILCFDHARWYARGWFSGMLAIGVAVVAYLLFAANKASLVQQVVGYTGTLFVACMVCHGELYRLRPGPARLTRYYLLISTGGALGGVLVAVVAPLIWNQYLEFQFGLWALSYLVGVVALRARSTEMAWGAAVGALLATAIIPAMRVKYDADLGLGAAFASWGGELKVFYGDYWKEIAAALAIFVVCVADRRHGWVREWRPRLGGFLMFLSVGLGIVLLVQVRREGAEAVDSSRNFYGTLKVYEYNADNPNGHYYLLMHGATTHGFQFTHPIQARWPTTYYGETSGVGLAIKHLPRPAGGTEGRKLGLVGLGTGTLAAYGEAGDTLRIYEINPAIERLARSRFTYLANAPAKVDVVMGDARLSMEHELRDGHPQQFDLLALDAFSSDAIPVHLLTQEAFATYLQHLKPDGVIAVHISNRYLNLRPVVEQLGQHFGLTTATIHDDDQDEWWVYRTTWILMTKNLELLANEDIATVTAVAPTSAQTVDLWTDDHASVFQILK